MAIRTVAQEFKEFAIKGSVIDLAVGVIIGGAFGKVISSLVNDIIMPPIGLLTSGVDFTTKVWVLKDATSTTPAVTLNYGLFINNIIIFIIVAICVFILVKQINKLKRKEEEHPTPPAPPITNEEKLLTEIRDLLQRPQIKNPL